MRCESRIRERLRNPGENRGRLGQHAAVCFEHRHPALRVDTVERGALLLAARKVDPPEIVVRPGVFERNMNSERTGSGRIGERQHREQSFHVRREHQPADHRPLGPLAQSILDMSDFELR